MEGYASAPKRLQEFALFLEFLGKGYALGYQKSEHVLDNIGKNSGYLVYSRYRGVNSIQKVSTH